MKNILSINRLTLYLIAFFCLLALIFAFTKFWKTWDYQFYNAVYKPNIDATNNNLDDDILIIDLQKTGDLQTFRKDIIRFLDTIGSWPNGERPKAIVLDIAFSKDTVQLDQLKAALENLKGKIDVYAAYDARELFEEKSKLRIKRFDFNDTLQAAELYDKYFKNGRLHTAFTIEDKIITYASELETKDIYNSIIKFKSLPKIIADNHFKRDSSDWKLEKFVVPVPDDSDRELRDQTRVFNIKDPNVKQLSKSDAVEDKYLLVGDLVNDYINDAANNVRTPGTQLLAWTLNEQIRHVDDRLAKQPLDSNEIVIGQTLFFSLLTVLVFALLFGYAKRLQTKPKLLAVLAFVIGLVFLSLYALVIFYFDAVIPIGLTLVAMILASILSWHFAFRFLATGVAEGSNRYDVFISYSHSDSAWVKKNVLEPLEAIRKENGDKLQIFFDEKSIGLGETFTAKYMWGIVDSKAFIPVMSKEYYGKNHCRNEMDLAYKRKVEKLLNIFPIAFSYDAVPVIYQGDIFADISVDQNFIEAIIDELLK